MEFAIPDVSVLDAILIALATLVAGTCSGLSGFGGGLLLPPVLAPILGVKAVVPVMSVAMLMSNGHRLWLYRHSLDRRLTLAVLATAVPGVVIGTTVYLRLPTDTVAILLGAFLLAAVPAGRWLARRQLRLKRRELAVCGVFYGATSGTTTGVGMLMVPVLLGAGLAGQAFLATDSAISVAVNLTKTAMFSSYTLLTPELLLVGVLMGLCTLPGNYLARWILRRTSLRLHTNLMELLIIVGGISLLWNPVYDALR